MTPWWLTQSFAPDHNRKPRPFRPLPPQLHRILARVLNNEFVIEYSDGGPAYYLEIATRIRGGDSCGVDLHGHDPQDCENVADVFDELGSDPIKRTLITYDKKYKTSFEAALDAQYADEIRYFNDRIVLVRMDDIPCEPWPLPHTVRDAYFWARAVQKVLRSIKKEYYTPLQGTIPLDETVNRIADIITEQPDVFNIQRK